MSQDRIRHLFEMPAINQGNKKLGNPTENSKSVDQERYEECQSSWDSIKIVDVPANTQSLETIEYFKQDNRIRAFLLDSEYTVCGFFSGETNTIKQLPPSFITILVTYVYKQYQGHGYGYQFYNEAMKIFGGIISDMELTDGTKAIWMKLSKNYTVSIFDGKTAKPFNIAEYKMKNTNERFVASRSPLKA